MSMPLAIQDDAANLDEESSFEIRKFRLSNEQLNQARRFQHWAPLLVRQQRNNGHRGVERIWRAMRSRGIDLPVRSAATTKRCFDTFWSTFVQSFMHDIILIKELLDHAADLQHRTGQSFHFLYVKIMKHYVNKDPATARGLFDHMKECGLLPPDSAAALIQPMLTSEQYPAARRLFKHVYMSSSERGLYDLFYHHMTGAGLTRASIQQWHVFLIGQGDLPSVKLRALPLVKQLMKDYSPIFKSNAIRSIQSEEQLLTDETPADDSVDTETPSAGERFDSIIGEIQGVKQKSVTDSFCARLFATGSISTGFMIAAVAAFGLDAIGPLALRELAARCETIAEFKGAMRNLKEQNITVTDCIFARALRKFAYDGKQDLFDSIVQSDRHPETYEQNDVLEKLLEADLLEGRTTDSHALLAILNMSDRQSYGVEWNLLLKAEIRNQRCIKVQSLIREMLLQGQTFRQETLRLLIDELLPVRRTGKQPSAAKNVSPDESSRLLLVTELYLSILNARQDVPVTTWRELIKRHGMAGQMHTLRQLCHRLAQHHTTPSRSTVDAGRYAAAQAAYKTRRLQYIFGDQMQKAIIAWGTQSSLREHGFSTRTLLMEDTPTHIQHSMSTGTAHTVATNTNTSSDKWLDGLRLLVELRDMGVPVSAKAVRTEITTRLSMIYTRGISFVASNRALKSSNDQSLGTRLDSVQRVWGANGLFHLPKHVREADEPEKSQLLYRLLFKNSARLRRSHVAMARKWAAAGITIPERGVRLVDRHAIMLLQHAWRERQEDKAALAGNAEAEGKALTGDTEVPTQG